MAAEAMEGLKETSSNGPNTAQPESQQEREGTPTHSSHDELPDAPPESEGSDFHFQDAHMPLDVCLPWRHRSGRCFKG
jgi:hypothetical protein